MSSQDQSELSPIPSERVHVEDFFDKADGVYLCVKNSESEFLWVNQNFADLIGRTKEELIGSTDDQIEHVADDRAVMRRGEPLLNLHETITVPTDHGQSRALPIVTQKGLLREDGSEEIIGVTVCFAEQFPETQNEAEAWIHRLGMKEIDLGGYFAPGSTSEEETRNACLPERFEGDRRFYNSNYYLLQAGEVLGLHTLQQDELWFYHRGFPIRLHIFPRGVGEYRCVTIGPEWEQGQALQGVAPYGHWFGAELPLPDGSPGFSLCSCSLSPGWDRRDSLLPSPDEVTELKKRFRHQADVIDRLVVA